MSKEKLFKELIANMAEDGEITSSEYEILLEKGKDLGYDEKTVNLLIKMELTDFSENSYSDNSESEKNEIQENDVHTFKSAITRGGSILTPDIIIVDNYSVTYKKRNKYLINVDSITVPISKISSVELDTSILGTNIIIKTFGAGEIVGKKFSKSDTKQIRKLIQERQRK